MISFSQKIIVPALVLMSVIASSFSMADVPKNDVTNTKHNLGVGGLGKVAANDSGALQICIFCHTPHNSVKTGPLWNKANLKNATIFKMYTSSSTLTSAAKSSSLSGDPGYNSPSLLCLSCHDGKTAMNILHNTTYGVTVTEAGLTADYEADYMVIPVGSGAGTAIAYTMPAPNTSMYGDWLDPDMRTGGLSGDNLTDDHPIGFSYSDAYDEKLLKGGGLKSPAVAMAGGVRFFGANQKMECSSCHNPHLNYGSDLSFSPFLVKSNNESSLCLTCHDK